MRIYQTFPDALNELKRDVAELGVRVHPQTMQDKYVADDPNYSTIEYSNQIFTVSKPSLEDLHPFVKTLEWCEAEFQERIQGFLPMDAVAWKLRPEVWQEFADRGLGYTYGERYFMALDKIIEELKRHPDSRQLFLSVWRPTDIFHLGDDRVPCSLGYWFELRQNKLHMTYLQRSADYFTHLANDMYLSHRLQRYIAEKVDAQVGYYVHWIGSLHVYKKDVADVF